MNFALILFVLLVLTGALWLFDHYVAGKKRAPGSAKPWWVEYGASFFPVILAVFFCAPSWWNPSRFRRDR